MKFSRLLSRKVGSGSIRRRGLSGLGLIVLPGLVEQDHGFARAAVQRQSLTGAAERTLVNGNRVAGRAGARCLVIHLARQGVQFPSFAIAQDMKVFESVWQRLPHRVNSVDNGRPPRLAVRQMNVSEKRHFKSPLKY